MEHLKDSEVQVILIRCKKCNHPVLTAVTHMLNGKDKKEIADLVLDGHKSLTMPLLDYRKITISGWCNTKCKDVG